MSMAVLLFTGIPELVKYYKPTLFKFNFGTHQFPLNDTLTFDKIVEAHRNVGPQYQIFLKSQLWPRILHINRNLDDCINEPGELSKWPSLYNAVYAPEFCILDIFPSYDKGSLHAVTKTIKKFYTCFSRKIFPFYHLIAHLILSFIFQIQ